MSSTDHTDAENARPGQAETPDVPGEVTSEKSDQNPEPREIGGRKGLDPVRYGDWEKAGRCIDF